MKLYRIISLTVSIITICAALCSCSKEQKQKNPPQSTDLAQSTQISVTTEPVIVTENTVDAAKEAEYNRAVDIITQRKTSEYETAYEIFKSLDGYKDSGEYLNRFVWRPLKKVITNGDDQTRIYDLEYDKNGYLIKDEDEVGNISYKYDDGLLIEKQDHFYRYYYTYDDNNVLIKEEQDGISYSSYNDDYMLYYTYDNNGNLTQKDKKPMEDTKVSYTYNYHYDNDGRLTTEIKRINNSYDPADTQTTTYIYNEYGQLIEKRDPYYVSNRDIQGKYCTYVFSYDTNGNLKKEELFDFSSETIHIIEYKDYTLFYNSLG